MTDWDGTPDEFISRLREAGLRRALFTRADDGSSMRSVQAALEPLAEALSADPNFDGHAAAMFEIGAQSEHLLAAFIHKVDRGQAAGGVRFWRYDTLGEMIRDGLRLSRGMGRKTALAGLWWGGGKGVIARRAGVDHRDESLRAHIYRDYGRFISSLAGCYVTAEDVGTRPQDMAYIFSTTRHTTCVPPGFGGSGNPSGLTARGVVVAMQAALEWSGRGSLTGKTVALQGIGNVALHMAKDLLDAGVARIVACDIDADAIATAREQIGDSRLELSQCEPGDHAILATECDVLAPSAIGGILNPATTGVIRAPVICGAANNQLERLLRDATALQERDVLYIPDFLANRMGIVNCANEQYGVFPGDPAIAVHLDREAPGGVYRRVLEVLDRAAESGRPPAVEATLLADELATEPHPIWGQRAHDIIDYLVASRWSAS